MRREAKAVYGRRKRVMQEIQENGKALVEDLAKQFDTTEITIRRDLKFWEEKGAIERFYGGARLVQPFVESEGLGNEPYKHAIAKYAARFVEDGETIFINTSSTALLMLRYLHNKNVTVITNNAKAVYTEHDPMVNVILTGGELRYPKHSMVGDFALASLQRVSADKAFLGCSGFDIEAGMSTAIVNEVTINEMMVQRCNGPIFLLADATKINTTHRFIVNTPRQFNALITDTRVPEHTLDDIKDLGMDAIALEPFTLYKSYQFAKPKTEEL